MLCKTRHAPGLQEVNIQKCSRKLRMYPEFALCDALLLRFEWPPVPAVQTSFDSGRRARSLRADLPPALLNNAPMPQVSVMGSSFMAGNHAWRSRLGKCVERFRCLVRGHPLRRVNNTHLRRAMLRTRHSCAGRCPGTLLWVHMRRAPYSGMGAVAARSPALRSPRRGRLPRTRAQAG